MRGRTRVLVLFGGRSSEHEVSCLSARSVLDALDVDRYEPICVGITREGRWTLVDDPKEVLGEVPGGAGAAPPRSPGDRPGGAALPSVPDDGDTVTLVQSRKGPWLVRFANDFAPGAALPCHEIGPVDVCFPVLHGPYGEDGTVQGLLASYGVPYVGADVASSAIGIDKRQMKNVFTARGLPQVPYLAVRRTDWDGDDRHAVVSEVTATLSFPLFTKPARQGSSIGIRRCTDRAQLLEGIEEAFTYDRVAIVEEGVGGGEGAVRELECGVLGNATVEVTRPGEMVHTGEFYDYQAKYLAPVELRCPADVSAAVAQTCMRYAREAYLAIGARGMARVDFFYDERAGRVLVNEINTIPGLTAASMFPPVWAAEGLDYPALVDRLLDLALDAARRDGRYAP